ncbi:MAG: hypothetical protein ABH864_02510 [archaeon]
MKKVLFVFALVLLALPLVAAECGDGNCTGNETFETCPGDCAAGGPLNCSEDTLTCVDGAVVTRDPLNNCDFYPCPDSGPGNFDCIDLCGDGVCQYEEECQGQMGCPCLETAGTCEADCSSSDDGNNRDGSDDSSEGFGSIFFSSYFWMGLTVLGAILFVYIGLKILKWLFWSLALIMVALAVLFWFVL